MKILHLPESFFPNSGGGKEVYTLRFAQALSSLGLQNIVAIHGADVHPSQYTYEGIEVRVLPRLINHFPYGNRYKRIVDEASGFDDLLNEVKPDIVHFHDQNNGASLTHLQIVKRKGIKAVVTFHTPGQVCPQYALLYKGCNICDGKLISSRCTSCQLQSFFKLPSVVSGLLSKVSLKISNPKGKLLKLAAHRYMTEQFIQSYRDFALLSDKTIVFTQWGKDTYLRNGIPESKIALIDSGGNSSIAWDRSRIYNSGEVFEVCYIGRCEYIKGIHLLVDAVKQLDASLPVKVFFYSHSWENTAYGQSLLAQIEGDTRFEKPSLVNNAELAYRISRHHVCVIPSIWPETGPLTVFDAFGSGLPIIGTNSAGIADRVRHEIDGLLFENNSVDDLKSCIEMLVNDHDFYNALRKSIMLNRTMLSVAKETLDLYSEILNKHD